MKLQFNSLFKEYQERVVLDGVSFTIQDNDKLGLIGPNGSGKTTLLKILAGVESPDKGTVVKVPQNLSVGYIPQVADLPKEKTVVEGLTDSLKLEDKEIYKIYIALADLGINQVALTEFGKLSSGQRTKIYLARLLIQTPDILLLDEPTNHLDIESLSWLEDYLESYKGAYIAVSHDRRFLDNTVKTILELEAGKIKVYGGDFSFYKQQKEIEREAQLRNFIAQEKKVERITERVRIMKNKTQQLEARTSGADHYMRRKAALSASKAKSTEKMLLKQLEEGGVEKPAAIPELTLMFKPKQESSKTVVFMDKISKTFRDQTLFKDFSLVINNQDRLALVGPNGCGKSTLIKLILSELKPEEGQTQMGNNVNVGYLAQEHTAISSSLSLLDYVVTQSKLDKTSAFRLMKRFLFSDEDLKNEVSNLSSGQKSKLALALIMASGANFIILDEPTNHLDILSREAVEEAIVSYPGTLLIVSHDRYFLDRIKPTKIISLR